MNLADLEFKAEDFLGDIRDLPVDRLPAWATLCSQMAEQANRLLRERLERAPELREFGPSGTWVNGEPEGARAKGRLVCVEEIKA